VPLDKSTFNINRVTQSGPLTVDSAGEYLRYKYLDTYLRYVKSILYLVSRYNFNRYLVSLSMIHLPCILYLFICVRYRYIVQDRLVIIIDHIIIYLFTFYVLDFRTVLKMSSLLSETRQQLIWLQTALNKNVRATRLKMLNR